MRLLNALRLLLVPALLAALGLLFAASPSAGTVSAVENRTLAAPPRCNSAESWFSGSCAREVDLYVADHFPGRERFVGAAFWMKDHLGPREEAPRIVPVRSMDEGWLERLEDWAPLDAGVEEPAGDAGTTPDGGEPDDGGAPPPADLEATAQDAGSGDAPALTVVPAGLALPSQRAGPTQQAVPAAAPRAPPPPAGKVEISGGILIAGDRAMQLFGGTDESATAYAQVINGYAERYAGRLKVYSVVVPSAVSFHLPADQARKSRSERENLAVLAAALRRDVVNPDTFPALAEHAADEPLYLRTDHHWNGLGAYRAYEPFCRAAGLVPVPLASFRHGQKAGFVGSFAAFTQDPGLRSAPDVVDHYDPPTGYTAERFMAADGTGPALPVRFVDGRARGYLVFLGGDAPLVQAHTDVKNGRRAIFVKNSFGNAFAPLLLPHFEELTVVDYRYYSGGLDALVEKTRATDLIFFNVTLLVNSAPHRQRLAALGRGGKAWDLVQHKPDAGTPAPDAGEAAAPGPQPGEED